MRRHASPRWWFDTAWERIWKRSVPHSIAGADLTWSFPPDSLEGLRILWPSKYAWEPRRIWGDQILTALRLFLDVEEIDIPQEFDRVITFFVYRGDRRFVVNIETSDYPELNEEAYSKCDLHFKMEYALDGYGKRDHLLAGGYVNADSSVYSFLHRLRRIRDESPPRYEVYGRYGLSLEKRRKPLQILSSSPRFAFFGGEGKVRYSRYLTETARAKVCIDLPSMSAITFRMIDYLAIGTCIVGPRHTNRLLMPFEKGVHVAYCKDDYSDLEDICVHYLVHDAERRKMVRNSREFFDTFVHRQQTASYYLHHFAALTA